MESKLFKIPIEEYERDMDTELGKEKKIEILDLFNNYNKLRSKNEFYAINNILHELCQQGDVELIKIFLSETIKTSSKDMKFKIDQTKRTASLFEVNYKIEEVIIPRTIKHESTEYLITSVVGTSVNLKKLKFVEDSEIKTIYRNVFPSNSKIEEIYIPASLKELKDGWCLNTNKLTKITISPLNGQFILKDEKCLLSKSDPNKGEFDILVFATRNINEISIPANILKICEYSFNFCTKLTKVEIPKNSNLQIINKYAFSSSNIEEIFIPSKVSRIYEGTFSGCKNLRQVEFPSDSNLQIIEQKAFYDSNIEEIFIPSTVLKICESAFSLCNGLTKVEIPPDSNLQIIEQEAFYNSDIEKIFIPSTVSQICEDAFSGCKDLREVEILPDSNLQIIESKTFYRCKHMRKMYIPSKVSKICESAFSGCYFMKKVEIPANSNLQTIESNAFSETYIDEIYIPANLKELKEGWCVGMNYLTKIIISPSNGQFIMKDDKLLLSKSDPNEDEFDILVFACHDIEEVVIPSNIKIISSGCFKQCKNLTKVEIPKNSNLQKIESCAFATTKIKKIFIPSNVSKICEKAFLNCKDLTKVEIPTNSNLQMIERFAFSSSNIEEIFIPSNVSKICENAFDECFNLKKVDIPTNSNLQAIEEEAFKETKIRQFFIPSNVSIFDLFAFIECYSIQIIEISDESKLDFFSVKVFIKSYISCTIMKSSSAKTKICI